MPQEFHALKTYRVQGGGVFRRGKHVKRNRSQRNSNALIPYGLEEYVESILSFVTDVIQSEVLTTLSMILLEFKSF